MPHLPRRIDGARQCALPNAETELFLRWDRDELPDVIDALAMRCNVRG